MVIRQETWDLRLFSTLFTENASVVEESSVLVSDFLCGNLGVLCILCGEPMVENIHHRGHRGRREGERISNDTTWKKISTIWKKRILVGSI